LQLHKRRAKSKTCNCRSALKVRASVGVLCRGVMCMCAQLLTVYYIVHCSCYLCFLI
jgi:hypothetical protein